MPEKDRVLTRSETERYIISERLPKQYSSADGGRAARFRFAQDSVSGLLSRTDAPGKRAELAGVLNSLRAFSGEFAKYAENRAMYDSAKQIYEEYLASPQSAGGSMLIPAEIEGEKVQIDAADLADIAYRSELQIQNTVKERHRAAEQEFGSDRVVNGVDFYGLTTPECADALLGYAENAAAGKPPEDPAQTAFAALNQRLAEKRSDRLINRGLPAAGPAPDSVPERTAPDTDLREQLDRAMERIAALEEQNRRLIEKDRLGHSERETAPERTENTGTVRERISFRQLLAEAGAHSSLTSAESVTPEMSAQKQRNL